MAITIDYSDGITPQYVINIPKADMTLVATVPTEVRQLNLDTFRVILNDLMDDAEGMPFPTIHTHTAPLTVAGVTLARVVEILDPYVIEFEDLPYNVNIVGGNSNVSDVTIKNTVGVNTANSAGLQDPFALQFAAFSNEVALMQGSGFSGTTFPLGTRSFPVDNLVDALAISELRGLRTIRVINDFTISTEDFSDGYEFVGDSPETTNINTAASSNVTNCRFSNATIMGTLDQFNSIYNCQVNSLDMFEGSIHESALGGTIILGPGAKATMVDCFSSIAGGGALQYPVVDCGGNVAIDLVVRGFKGGLGITNNSVAMESSIDMASGRVVFDNTVTAGDFTVRGISDVQDDSAGATVTDLTINKDIRTTRKHSTNKLITDPITGITTLYDDDGAVIATSDMFEDAAGAQPYRGSGAERREKFT